jgi:redox-sensing transcriptional repressor
MDSTQVRKDLSITGINGKPRVGYQVAELIQAIEEFLGWRNATDAFLVGAGHLGAALLGFDRFPDLGLRIVAAFDTDPAKIGAVIHGKEVLSMEKLPDLAFRMHIHIGVLTVPARAAQESTDILIGSGIRAIWNFTAARLDAPDDCVVENVDLSSSFAVLSARLRTILKE